MTLVRGRRSALGEPRIGNGILISSVRYYLIPNHDPFVSPRRFEKIFATFTALLGRTENHSGEDGEGSAKNVDGKVPNEPTRDVSVLFEEVDTFPGRLLK